MAIRIVLSNGDVIERTDDDVAGYVRFRVESGALLIGSGRIRVAPRDKPDYRGDESFLWDETVEAFAPAAWYRVSYE